MDVIKEIEAALAAGPTEGPWRHNKDNGQVGDVAASDDYSVAISQSRAPADHAHRDIDAAYIAACNPANMRAILQLIADRDAEIERLKEALEQIVEMTDPESDHENYRSDDREGCLDATFAVSSAALNPTQGANK